MQDTENHTFGLKWFNEELQLFSIVAATPAYSNRTIGFVVIGMAMP